MPAIQVAVGCKFFRSYGHEGGGTTVREHWCQITEVVVRSAKGANQVRPSSPQRESATNESQAAHTWNVDKSMAPRCERPDLNFAFMHSEENLPEGFLNSTVPTATFPIIGGRDNLPTIHGHPPSTAVGRLQLHIEPLNLMQVQSPGSTSVHHWGGNQLVTQRYSYKDLLFNDASTT